jgi:HK97 family phage portal protein
MATSWIGTQTQNLMRALGSKLNARVIDNPTAAPQLNSAAQAATYGPWGGAMGIGSLSPVYPDTRDSCFLRDGYTNNAAIYSIVSLAARKFSSIKWYTYKIKSQKEARTYKQMGKSLDSPLSVAHSKLRHIKAYEQEVDEESELSKLLNRPNPMQGQDAFWSGVYSYYKTVGEAFIWLNRGIEFYPGVDDMGDVDVSKKPILEMWVLPTDKMILVPDPNDVNGVLYYQMEINGTYIPFRKEDIIHWKTFNPNFDATTRAHMRGMAPLRAGLRLMTMNDEAVDSAVSMFQNGGAKGVLYDESMGKLSVTQRSQVEDVINEKINNNKRKAAVASLQGKWGYLNIGLDAVDQELLNALKLTLEQLCNLQGVPPELFITGNTYENKNQARRDLLTNLIIPDCCGLRDELNRVLLKAFGANSKTFTIDIDYSDIPELQEDLKKLAEILNITWWFTPNERRVMMNEEPLDDKNMDKIYIPSTLQSIDRVDMDVLTSQANQGGYNDYARGGGGDGDAGDTGDRGGKNVRAEREAA